MRGSVLWPPSLPRQHFPHSEFIFPLYGLTKSTQHLCFLFPNSVIALDQYADRIVGGYLCKSEDSWTPAAHSRNLPNGHCVCGDAACPGPGVSVAVIPGTRESAGGCLHVVYMTSFSQPIQGQVHQHVLVPIFIFSNGSKVTAAAYRGLLEHAPFSLDVRNQLGQFSPFPVSSSPFQRPQCCPTEVITST